MKDNIPTSEKPRVHFTPEKGWMNDPNGMVFYDDKFHMFYQYIPDKLIHSDNLHWGHAVSKDLINWEYKNIALRPDEKGANWSGSVVVDWHNSSILQTGVDKVLVALFSQGIDNKQLQSLAYSNDKGETWKKYFNNPVLRDPGIKDFRDPKVFWYESDQMWKMVLACGNKICLYESADLKHWQPLSDIQIDINYPQVVLECPDFFPLPVGDSQKDIKWALVVSLNANSRKEGSGIKYFIGDFDGMQFSIDPGNTKGQLLDYGPDNHAGVTFSDIPDSDGRRVYIAWMGNWIYGNETPTQSWRGMMTIPRELDLIKDGNDHYQLRTVPVSELEDIRNAIYDECHFSYNPLYFKLGNGCAYDCIIDFNSVSPGIFTLEFGNENGENVRITFNREFNRLQLDRSNTKNSEFHSEFSKEPLTATLDLPDKLQLRIILDRYSLEIFVNEGLYVMSSLIFPDSPFNQLKLSISEKLVEIKNVKIWSLN